MNDERQPRLYVDNAATSFPKPEQVYLAVDDYQRRLGVAVGRGATHVGQEVLQTVQRCRVKLARLLGVADSSHVIFSQNGTDSLNLALHGMLQAGDHVIASCWEHNSVLRPLKTLAAKGVHTEIIGGDGEGCIDLDLLSKAVTSKTKLVCLTHASNVTGVIQPVADVVEIAHRAGAYVLLDAAQTAGHMPVSMQDLNVDMISSPGHKGLLGPLGTGILALRSGLEGELTSVRQGGTGTRSESEAQPDSLPDKYESGNHNAPGIFGLNAALDWIEAKTVSALAKHTEHLTQLFVQGIAQLSGLEAYLVDSNVNRIGVVSLNAARLEPQVLCSVLDEHFQIETRAGLHCSPRAHAELGTDQRGGTVRFSFGPFHTADDVDRILESLGQIVAAF